MSDYQFSLQDAVQAGIINVEYCGVPHWYGHFDEPTETHNVPFVVVTWYLGCTYIRGSTVNWLPCSFPSAARCPVRFTTPIGRLFLNSAKAKGVRVSPKGVTGDFVPDVVVPLGMVE